MAGGNRDEIVEMAEPDTPFWKRKQLDEMSPGEWESLCDGCAKCCLVKLEDERTDEIEFTDVACRLLELETCRCSDYPNRASRVPGCVELTPAKIAAINWLPPSCAYRLVARGEDLPWWHPLKSGRRQTVIDAGASIAGRVVSEAGMDETELESRIVTWPQENP